MKNILVVNVNWIGDVIFSTPVFRSLKEKYPEARVVCMGIPGVVPVLKACPYVDDIIVYDEKGKDRWLWNKVRLIFKLRRYHFDIAFLLHRSWTRAFLVYLAGVKIRIGYDLKDLGRLLTQKVELPQDDVHRSDYYLNIIESYGILVNNRLTEIVPSDLGRRRLQDLLLKEGILPEEFLVVVNTGGNWDLKRWPKESFSVLIEKIITDLGIKVVIPGASKDQDLAHEIKEHLDVEPVVLAGRTDLDQMFALMERADLVISSDSGPLHIASSVGTTTISIFGPTRPEITGPRGRGKSIVLMKDVGCNARACYQLDCPDNQCMKSVTVGEVFDKVREVYEMVRGDDNGYDAGGGHAKNR